VDLNSIFAPARKRENLEMNRRGKPPRLILINKARWSVLI